VNLPWIFPDFHHNQTISYQSPDYKSWARRSWHVKNCVAWSVVWMPTHFRSCLYQTFWQIRI
jgi:hypothetical protein